MKFALEFFCNKARHIVNKMFNTADEAWEYARKCHMSATAVWEGTEEEIKQLLEERGGKCTANS